VPTSIVVVGPDSMIQGESAQFTATLLDADAIPISGKRISWYSEDSSAATVTQAGLVTAIQPGRCRIRAYIPLVAGTAEVIISDAAISHHLLMSGPLRGLAISGNKGYIPVWNSDSILVLDIAAERRTGVIHTGSPVASIAFNPAGTRAYFTTDDGKLGAIDAASDSTIGTVSIAPGIDAPLTSADGGTVWVISGFYGRLYAVNAVTLAVVDSTRIPESSHRLVLNPTLNRLYLTGDIDAVVRELDAGTLVSLRSWNLGGRPNGMALSLDGTRLFVANGQNWVDEIQLSSGVVSSSVPLPSGAGDIVLSPDGVWLAVISTPPQIFFLYSSTRSMDKTVRIGGQPSGLGYRADGTRLLVANFDGWVDFIR